MLRKVIARRQQTIQQFLAFSDTQLKELKKNLYLAKEMAVVNPGFASVEILEERIDQVRETEEIKYSLSEDASDWIHW